MFNAVIIRCILFLMFVVHYYLVGCFSYFEGKYLWSISSPPTHAVQLDGETVCALHCEFTRGNMFLFDVSTRLCQIYNVENSSLSQVPSGASLFIKGEGLTSLDYDLEQSLVGFWGEYYDMIKCSPQSTVYAFSYWYDFFDDMAEPNDDLGLTKVRIFCATSVGKETDDLASGAEYAVAQQIGKRSCPGDSRVIGLRYTIQASYRGPGYDDDGMISLDMECNDVLSTQLIGNTGLEHNPADLQHSGWVYCKPGFAICGVQIKIEEDQDTDNTAANDIKASCCLQMK